MIDILKTPHQLLKSIKTGSTTLIHETVFQATTMKLVFELILITIWGLILKAAFAVDPVHQLYLALLTSTHKRILWLDKKTDCTGSIISKNWILTAAQCVSG